MSVNAGTGALGAKAFMATIGFLAGIAAVSFALLWMDGADGDFPWGFALVTWMFVLGLSQAGICFTAVMRLCKAEFSGVFYRLGEVMTLAFLPFAFIGFALIFSCGRESLFYWLQEGDHGHLSPWLNENLLLWRNLVALAAFYGLSVLYFLWGLLPDTRDELADSGNPVCRVCWRWLASWRGRVDTFTLQRRLYFSSFFILFFYVMSNSFIAWDFGMTLISHYHSSVYPLYYIQGINLAGAAAVLLMSAVLWRCEGLKEWFDAGRLKQMGILITSFSLLWLYMFWAQFFVSWFGNLDYEYGVVSLQMYGHYQPYFWAMVSGMFFIPLLCGIAAWVKRTWPAMLVLSGFIVVGFWINRYLNVMPILEPAHVPFADVREWLIAISALASWFFLVLVMFRSMPMISAWQISNYATEEQLEAAS
ncbi:MAG: hypothetical protein OXG29_03200 [Gammaproteobacteria bacterium]|nr:hypothetical protein [Gammaproteobacteria bacterium]